MMMMMMNPPADQKTMHQMEERRCGETHHLSSDADDGWVRGWSWLRWRSCFSLSPWLACVPPSFLTCCCCCCCCSPWCAQAANCIHAHRSRQPLNPLDDITGEGQARPSSCFSVAMHILLDPPTCPVLRLLWNVQVSLPPTFLSHAAGGCVDDYFRLSFLGGVMEEGGSFSCEGTSQYLFQYQQYLHFTRMKI